MSELIFDKTLLEQIGRSQFDFLSDGIQFPQLGHNLILRPLSSDDYEKGFLDVLQQLTEVGSVSREVFLNRFRSMLECKDSYYVLVIEDTSKNLIVGSASLIVEQKFIHSCSKRGRIEDVVVSKDYRKRDLGKILILTLCSLSEKLACYKTTLDCKDPMVTFYENFGFKKEPNNSNYLQKRFDKLSSS